MKIFVDIDSTITDFGKVLLDTLNVIIINPTNKILHIGLAYWTFGKKSFLPLIL